MGGREPSSADGPTPKPAPHDEPPEFRRSPQDPGAVVNRAVVAGDDLGDPIEEGRRVGGETVNIRTEVKQREHIKDLRRTIRREADRADDAKRSRRTADEKVLALSIENQRLRDRIAEGRRRDAILSFLAILGGGLVSLFPLTSTGPALVGTATGVCLLLGAGIPLVVTTAARAVPGRSAADGGPDTQ